MKRPRLILVSNALDDKTRLQRGISTDSPAASRKVLDLCKALRMAGVDACVLSLGRGRADGSLRLHRGFIRRIDGVPVLYAPFARAHLFSHLVSLLAPAWILRHAVGQPPRRRTAVLFYNRRLAYTPSLLVARALGLRTLFDLEDGEVSARDGLVAKTRAFLLRRIYDWACVDGCLLACSALADMTSARRMFCYYGTWRGAPPSQRWRSETVTVLLGGTLAEETGVPILVDAIQHLRDNPGPCSRHLRFVITGKGPALDELVRLANEPGFPEVLIHGRLTDREYDEILAGCEVGLALKPRGGHLANTTFPSKVVEMAGAGLLVLTTDISDVRKVLGAGAVYLEEENGAALAKLLCWVTQQNEDAQTVARLGQKTIEQKCSPHIAGQAVADFLFGSGQ